MARRRCAALPPTRLSIPTPARADVSGSALLCRKLRRGGQGHETKGQVSTRASSKPRGQSQLLRCKRLLRESIRHTTRFYDVGNPHRGADHRRDRLPYSFGIEFREFRKWSSGVERQSRISPFWKEEAAARVWV